MSEPIPGLLPLPLAKRLVAGHSVHAQVTTYKELWQEEERIGLERDDSTRTAAEGKLFRIIHYRPTRPTGSALAMLIDGIPEEWPTPTGLIPFGARGRLADLRVIETSAIDLSCEPDTYAAIRETGHACLVAVTPMLLDPAQWTGQAPLPDVGGARVVCGVGERPIRIGGWDGRYRRSVPQASYLPPGTVLFVEHSDGRRLADAVTDLGSVPQVGSRCDLGFGVVLVGCWPDNER